MVPRSKILLSPAPPSTFPTLAKLYHSAFSPSVVDQAIFGRCSPSIFIENATELIAADPSAIIIQARLNSNSNGDGEVEVEDGKIVGYALWRYPKSEEETKEWKERRKKVDWPEGTDVELAEEVFGRSEKIVVEGKHYYLSHLVVDPQHQNQGIGAALLKHGLEKADADGVQTILIGSVEGLPLYKKVGFIPYGDPIVGGHNKELSVYPMIRPPPVRSNSTKRLKYSLSVAPKSDYPTLARLLCKAFDPALVTKVIYANCTSESIIENAIQRLNADSTVTAVCARIDEPGDAEGRIVGYALWRYPMSDEKAQEGRSKRHSTPWPDGTDVELAEGLFGQSKKVKITGAHYYLSNLIVVPDFQHQGIGKALLLEGLNRADSGAVKTHLIASPEGLPLYKSVGFITYGETPTFYGGHNRELEALPNVATPSLNQTRSQPLPALFFAPSRTIFQSLFSKVKKEDFVALGTKRFVNVIRNCDKDGVALVVALLDGKVVGVAYWDSPRPKLEAPKTPTRREFAPGSNEVIARDFFERCTVEYMDPTVPPNYCLQILATSPTAQRTGAGSALLKWGIEKAQKENVNVRLYSSKEALTYYPKFGFEKAGEPLVASDGSCALYPMVLTPRGSSA